VAVSGAEEQIGEGAISRRSEKREIIAKESQEEEGEVLAPVIPADNGICG
jgi:hypothetical protein